MTVISVIVGCTRQGVLFREADPPRRRGPVDLGDYKPERFCCLQVDEFRNVALGGAFAPDDYAGPTVGFCRLAGLRRG